jgi:hypothetical protein
MAWKPAFLLRRASMTPSRIQSGLEKVFWNAESANHDSDSTMATMLMQMLAATGLPTCDVSCAEEELRPVVCCEGCVAAALILGQSIHLSLKLLVHLGGARLADHLGY